MNNDFYQMLNKDYIVLTKTITPLKNRALPRSLPILFMTKQSGTNFNYARQASTAFLHILWDLYLSRQYFNIKRSLETTFSHIS